MSEALAWVAYGAAWTSFGVLHSILAATSIKRRLDRVFGAGYRLAYNIFALINVFIVVAIGHALFDAAPFDLSHAYKLLLSMLAISGWVLMFVSLRQYDLGRFAGTAQLRAARRGEEIEEDEALTTTGLHRYVRHPLYSGAFLALWGAAWTPLGLATAVFASAYLLVGARYEERRLLARYGAPYAEYKTKVPAFFPWRRPSG